MARILVVYTNTYRMIAAAPPLDRPEIPPLLCRHDVG